MCVSEESHVHVCKGQECLNQLWKPITRRVIKANVVLKLTIGYKKLLLMLLCFWEVDYTVS